MKIQNLFLTALLLLIVLFRTTELFAQTTGFTYHGRLTDTSVAANGNYDMNFSLFDAAGAGIQVGTTQNYPTAALTSGIFEVSLEYGATTLPGAARFLEICFRPSGSAPAYTPLAHRLPVASTPHAVRSLKAEGADTAT